MTDVSSLVSAIIGRKTVEALNRRRMAILLATLVLLVLSSPIADLASRARFVIIGATVVFLLSCLQQVEANPRLRLASRLMVLFWLILNLPLPWLDGAWAMSTA